MQWKRIFKQKGFYLAAALQLFAYFFAFRNQYFWEFLKDFFNLGSVFYFFANAIQEEGCVLFLPFIAVLPAASFIGEDIETGFIRLVLQRRGKSRYIFTSMMQAMGGAGLASLTGSLLYVLFLLIFSPLGGDHHGYEAAFQKGSLAFLVNSRYSLPYIFETVLRFALTAAIWALVGLGISALCKSTGLTLALTFMVHFSLIYFMESFYTLFEWSPGMMQTLSYLPTAPLPVLYLRQTLYLLPAIGFSAGAGYRQIKQLQ